MSNISDVQDTEAGQEGATPAVEDLSAQLAQSDPLMIRPHRSSRVLCAAIGVVLLLASAITWWVGVRTVTGQEYDDLVWTHFHDAVPSWLTPALSLFTNTYAVPAVAVVMAVIVIVVSVLRKRWWLLGQLFVFMVVCAVIPRLLKGALPRPVLINSLASQSNSAPSGHTLLACAAGVILVCAVPRAWRAVAAVVAVGISFLVALSVVDGQWHRPTDTIMALLIAGGLAFIMLAFTRRSGMDAPGTRMSSASVQIVSSVMITAGVLACAYGAYVAWQIQPGLEFSAQWARSGAHISFMVMQLGLTALIFGLLLAMRHITASPLSKIGLVGAPPAPPQGVA